MSVWAVIDNMIDNMIYELEADRQAAFMLDQADEEEQKMLNYGLLEKEEVTQREEQTS